MDLASNPARLDPSRNAIQDDRWTNRAWIGWMHLGAFAIAMSVTSKGAPGGFPVVFLIAFAIIDRSFVPIRRFFTSGAIITLFVLAAPWFLFVGHHEGWGTFLFELRNVQAGTDHGGPIIQYVPWLIVGTLPWSLVVIIAIIIASRAWKHDWRLRGLLIWLGAIAVPLCLTRNKQSHYLIPLMPVLMIFAGWLIDRWNKRILIGAVIVVALVLPPFQTLFLPRYGTDHTRDNAQFVREHFGDLPLCFYGPNESVPLCFNLRRAIEFANDEPELKRFLAHEPRFVIITIGKDKPRRARQATISLRSWPHGNARIRFGIFIGGSRDTDFVDLAVVLAVSVLPLAKTGQYEESLLEKIFGSFRYSGIKLENGLLYVSGAAIGGMFNPHVTVFDGAATDRCGRLVTLLRRAPRCWHARSPMAAHSSPAASCGWWDLLSYVGLVNRASEFAGSDSIACRRKSIVSAGGHDALPAIRQRWQPTVSLLLHQLPPMRHDASLVRWRYIVY